MTQQRPAFQGGWRTVVGFAAAFALVTVIWVPLTAAVSTASAWVQLVTEIGKFAVIIGAVGVLLHLDEVRFFELGLSRWHLRTAVLAFAGLWMAMNAFGFVVAVLTGNDWAVSMIWQFPEAAPEVQRYSPLPATSLVVILLNFFVIGLIEEITFRGYFQSKIIDVFGHNTRLRIALGIGVTTIVFGVLHTPAAIVAGNSLGGVVGAALAPTVTAVLFGIFYELTHNVYFVALLHGFGNTWPIVVEWANWSGTSLIAFWLGTACIYFSVTYAYRYWTAGRASKEAPSRTSSFG
jgi:membrane protease YdiL (CAAX protease family)